jgi:4-amino-4-deoxy-L-arabinose transferase-like glycosyltransferase
MLYFLGKKYFGKNIGLLAAVLYATSPIIVVNARMPYHTSLVPFFTILFFLVLPNAIKKQKQYFFLGFLLGLLLLVELSNIVVFAVTITLFVFYRVKTDLKKATKFITGFFVGIMPFVLYDFIYGPAYLKFPLWIVNRIFRITDNTSSDQGNMVANFFPTLYQQVCGIISPNFPFVAVIIFLISFLFLAKRILRKQSIYKVILLLWIALCIVSFSIHNSPGTAYFTVLYPAIALVVAYSLGNCLKPIYVLLFVLILAITNVNSLLSNDFFVNSKDKVNAMPPTNYSFGNTYQLAMETSKVIVDDAKGTAITLVPQGIMTLYKTSLDPYKFFVWYLGGNLVRNGKVYIISESGFETENTIIFQNRTDQVATYD